MTEKTPSMLSNPFSPIFCGKPDTFFGRRRILAGFDYATRNRGGDMRALIVSGTRGSGKTALLEQLSRRARSTGRSVIDLGPDGVIDSLARNLVRPTAKTRTVDPRPGAGGVPRSKTVACDAADLQKMLLEASSQEKGGVLVTVDEVRKVSLDDLSAICGALQTASDKGLDVTLAVAGLPSAHHEVIRCEGCAYMRRARHVSLGLLSKSEAIDAFGGALALMDGLTAGPSEIAGLAEASHGHPYVMQLLGHRLVRHVDERAPTMPYTVCGQDVSAAVSEAVGAYERRALRPMLDELAAGEVAYLRAMAGALDEPGIAKTGDVARAMGKISKQVSRPRGRLLRDGIIVAPAHGQLAFSVPYLASYVLKESDQEDGVRRVLEWRL